MRRYRVRVVGGWCGNRLMMVTENLAELFKEAGYCCEVTHHSIWQSYTLPPRGDLLLQLLPAFTEAEAACPVIDIKPFLVDLQHPPTTDKIMKQVRADYQGALER
jgi:hypothetical protein